MIKLSVVIITYNEERNIERCIDSVINIADEILIIDSFSTDKTKEICEAKGVRFLQNKFEGHIEQKNFAWTQTEFDHILSIDADEAVTPMLRKSIAEVKNYWTEEGYEINRLNNYCGTWIKTCGWYPDTKLRLFKKWKGCWQGTNPHDSFKLHDNKKAGWLQGDLLHYTYHTVEDHKERIQYFAQIAAKEIIKKGKRTHTLKLILNPLSKFFKSYIVKLGFMDGYKGFLISFYAAKGTYLKYKFSRAQK
ncbi:MAG: glycosyltransferase family 2 protein [Flavobacteriales bacterium]|nr:glycosyltransferase family 2 protein [Flavobacteriales bacterium]